MGIRRLSLSDVPRAGSYSHSVSVGNILFISGQLGVSSETKKDFRAQFNLAMSNIKKICQANGTGLENILKMVVYISNASYFDEMNKIFSEIFEDYPPVRTTIVCSFPNPDALVELEATVFVS